MWYNLYTFKRNLLTFVLLFFFSYHNIIFNFDGFVDESFYIAYLVNRTQGTYYVQPLYGSCYIIYEWILADHLWSSLTLKNKIKEKRQVAHHLMAHLLRFIYTYPISSSSILVGRLLLRALASNNKQRTSSVVLLTFI